VMRKGSALEDEVSRVRTAASVGMCVVVGSSRTPRRSAGFENLI